MTSEVIDKKNDSYMVKGKDVELAILISDVPVTYDNNIAKIVIPSITPTLSQDSVIENKVPNSSSGVINRDNLGTSSITTTNYFEVEIPKYMFTIKEIITTITPNTRHGGEDNAIVSCNPKAVNTIVYNEFVKGQKFLITFLEQHKPYIVGVI